MLRPARLLELLVAQRADRILQLAAHPWELDRFVLLEILSAHPVTLRFGVSQPASCHLAQVYPELLTPSERRGLPNMSIQQTRRTR